MSVYIQTDLRSEEEQGMTSGSYMSVSIGMDLRARVGADATKKGPQK
jgi:hypothetical protein